MTNLDGFLQPPAHCWTERGRSRHPNHRRLRPRAECPSAGLYNSSTIARVCCARSSKSDVKGAWPALPKERSPQYGVMLDANRRWPRAVVVTASTATAPARPTSTVAPVVQEVAAPRSLTLCWLFDRQPQPTPPRAALGPLVVIGDAVRTPRAPSNAGGIHKPVLGLELLSRPRSPTGSRRPEERPATWTGSWSTSPSRTAPPRDRRHRPSLLQDTPARTSLESWRRLLELTTSPSNLYTKGQRTRPW